MMKYFVKTLAAAATVLCAFSAQALTTTIKFDGVDYTWTYALKSDGTVKIYKGSKSAAVSPNPASTLQKPFEIPSTIFYGGADRKVTEIGDSAFYQCDNIESVIIPDTVTTIASSAFYQCTKLLYVELPASVTTVGSSAFYGCSALASLSLAEGLTKIGSWAFYNCDALESVMLPDSLTDLEGNAFNNCSNLRLVSALDTLVITEQTGFYPFKDCPADLEIIRRHTETVDGIAWSYVLDKDGNATVYKGEAVPAIPVTTSGNITVPATLGGKPVTAIGPDAFYSCEDLEHVTIPEGVTSIGEDAFYCCDDLESVTIPASVQSIGAYAFSDCDDLEHVVIPAGVTRIEDSTFDGCSSLTRVTIPDSVTSIGDSAFWGCEKMKRITLPASVTKIEDSAFRECTALEYAAIGKGVEAIPEYAFAECSSLEAFVVPEGVKSIQAYAFLKCTDLESIAIPKSVTSIGANAFYDTGSLKTIYVAPGETETVKKLMTGKGHDVSKLSFVEAHTVTFDANGGTTEMMYMVRETGKKLGTLPKATKTDDTFVGWFTALKGGTQVTAETVITSNVTFYARWKSAGGAFSYTYLDKKDITEPYTATKAQTMLGVVVDKDGLAGVIEIKFGKVNLKKQTCKVSGTLTMLNGKKYNIKSQKVDVNDKLASSAVLTVKRLGTLYLAFGGTRFAGDVEDYHVQVANVGGSWTKSSAKVTVETSNLDEFSGDVLAAFLPQTEETTSITRGKWTFAKAASVKWAKPKAGATVLVSDASSGKGLIVDTSKGKTNLSGLKLTYTPKKGTFKGSFKVYALQGASGSIKLKKYSMSVNGVVIEGFGQGFATIKRPAVSWNVTVE